MLEMYSFVDYFTIPPSFVSIYLDRTWIGELWYSFGKESFWRCLPCFRSSFPSSASTYVSSRHFTIFKYLKNIQFHSSGAISFDIYIGMVNSSWNYSFGEFFFFFRVPFWHSRAFRLNKYLILNSWKTLATHWNSTILINYPTGHVFIFSLSQCQRSAMVTFFVKQCSVERFSYSFYLLDWWVTEQFSYILLIVFCIF